MRILHGLRKWWIVCCEDTEDKVRKEGEQGNERNNGTLRVKNIINIHKQPGQPLLLKYSLTVLPSTRWGVSIQAMSNKKKVDCYWWCKGERWGGGVCRYWWIWGESCFTWMSKGSGWVEMDWKVGGGILGGA